MRDTTSSTLATTSPSKTDQTPTSSTSRLSTQANPTVTSSMSLITTDNASDEEFTLRRNETVMTIQKDNNEHNHKKTGLGGKMGPAKREKKGMGTDGRWI